MVGFKLGTELGIELYNEDIGLVDGEVLGTSFGRTVG